MGVERKLDVRGHVGHATVIPKTSFHLLSDDSHYDKKIQKEKLIKIEMREKRESNNMTKQQIKMHFVEWLYYFHYIISL